jgi:protein SCO1/2
MKRILFLVTILGLYFTSCSEKSPLPIHGPKEFIEGVDKDTVYHTIPYWSFDNQEGVRVSSEDYKGKIYIADFFFSHCPSICPEMLESLKVIQSELADTDLEIVSYTVDPKNDNVARLNWYAKENEINTANWNFVTGVQQDIYELGVKGYLVPNQEDALAPGGFLHSEKIMLIDKKSRIRGWYDGTEESEVAQLIIDVRRLNNEK